MSETMSMNQPKALARTKGFTLIEIMVVMVILGLLVAIVAPNIMGRSDQAMTPTEIKDDTSNRDTLTILHELRHKLLNVFP